MLSSPLLVVLSGAVTAFTPAGFEPASTDNLSVVFGDTLAVDGKDIPKAETAQAPIVGTSNKLFGMHTIMMVDPDIPTQTAGGRTSELLHWMQPGLVSASNSTFLGGVQMFELVNPSNISAFATYIQPPHPDKAPNTHRYTQWLLNTTGNRSALYTLARSAATRTNYNAVDVVKDAGLTVSAGNSFNVTNGTLAQANITKTSGSAAGVSSTVTRTLTLAGTSATGTANEPINGTAPKIASGMPYVRDNRAAYIAGLGAFAAAVMML